MVDIFTPPASERMYRCCHPPLAGQRSRSTAAAAAAAANGRGPGGALGKEERGGGAEDVGDESGAEGHHQRERGR